MSHSRGEPNSITLIDVPDTLPVLCIKMSPSGLSVNDHCPELATFDLVPEKILFYSFLQTNWKARL